MLNFAETHSRATDPETSKAAARKASAFSASQAGRIHLPKLHNGLADPRNNMRKGGISLPSDPQACSDKTAKIIGKALGAPRSEK